MDTKSKNNDGKEFNKLIMKSGINLKIKLMLFLKSILTAVKNINVNKRIIMLSVCISLLPILFGIITVHGFINREDIINNVEVRSEIESVNDCLDKLNYYLDYSEESFREEAVDVEIKELKDENLKKIEQAKADFEMYKIKNNIDESEKQPDDKYYNECKAKVAKAEDYYNKNEEEYKKDAEKNIISKVQDIKSQLKGYVNIQYYTKSNNDNIITNIYGQTINNILEENYKYNDYIIYSGIYDNVAQQIRISKSMKQFSSSVNISNVTTKIIRISNQLKEGDAIYDKLKNFDENNNTCILCSILLLIDIIVILILVCIRNKNIEYEGNYITKKYSMMIFEIKVIIIMALCVWLFIMYETNCKITIHYIMALMQLLICSLIIYLLLSDIYINLQNKSGIMKQSFILKRLNRRSDSFEDKRKNVCVKILIILAKILLDWLFVMSFNSPRDVHFNYFYIDPGIIISVDLVITIAIIVYAVIAVININNIDKALNIIMKGNYENDIKVYGFGITKNIAENITNIKDGFNDAVENAIKSERMKTELITNVSHDLKTPLTSIINYVDLLSKDDVSEEEKKKYLDILNNRSLRLKYLIEDLFEAAKASSGSLEYNLEQLDPVALLRQALGEFEEKITSCGLTVIKTFPENKLKITADGKKAFRVIQNLISNITKYSMSNSRVYIDIAEEEKYVLMVFKNISEHQMNFTEEEILERFKRGDASRTTEGSGLGLAIAKSLVEGQGGLFEIRIDGDLFKAEIRFKKSN